MVELMTAECINDFPFWQVKVLILKKKLNMKGNHDELHLTSKSPRMIGSKKFRDQLQFVVEGNKHDPQSVTYQTRLTNILSN